MQTKKQSEALSSGQVRTAPTFESEASFDLAALVAEAENQAAQGCGQSDVLYEARVQDAYQSILDRAPKAMREEVEAELKGRGYDPDYVPYEAREGECSLTGIDEFCCPCGRHP